MRRDVGVDPLTALRRSWRLIALCALLGVAALAALSAALPRTWTSAAVVRVVQQAPTTPGAGAVTPEDPARVVATQRDLVLSDDVVEVVSAAVGVTADDVRARTKVTADTVADTLTITATAGSAVAAQSLARSVSETYVARVRSSGQEALSTVIASNSQALQALQALAVNATLPAFQRQAASAQFQQLSQQTAALTTQRDAFQGPAQIVSGARLPTAPSSLSPTKAGLLGLLLGLLLGVGAALLRSSRRERLTWVSDIVTTARLPLLADVPYARTLSGGVSRLRLELLPDAGVVEAARGLAVTLTADPTTRSVLVTSTSRYDGKTTVASQLAVAAALSGLRTVVIAADVRAAAAIPELPADAFGLTDLLLHSEVPLTPEERRGARWATAIPSLSVVGVGRHGAQGADLLRGPRLADVLAELSEAADLVIVDGPTVSVPETVTMAGACSAVVLCVGTHDARRSVIRDSVAGLQAVTERLLGLVVIDTEDRVRPEHSDYDGEPVSTTALPGRATGSALRAGDSSPAPAASVAALPAAASSSEPAEPPAPAREPAEPSARDPEPPESAAEPAEPSAPDPEPPTVETVVAQPGAALSPADARPSPER